MAGRLVVSTLNNDTGVLQTQNGMTGIAKAWVNFNGVTTATIRDSFNVSSVTRNGTGDYTVNFTTAMPNANYSAVVSCTMDASGSRNDAIGIQSNLATPSTTALRLLSQKSDGTDADQAYVCVAVFSS